MEKAEGASSLYNIGSIDSSEEVVNLIDVLEVLELSAVLMDKHPSDTAQIANNSRNSVFDGANGRLRQVEIVLQLTEIEALLETSVRSALISPMTLF
jgi:hypothetical protein